MDKWTVAWYERRKAQFAREYDGWKALALKDELSRLRSTKGGSRNDELDRLARIEVVTEALKKRLA